MFLPCSATGSLDCLWHLPGKASYYERSNCSPTAPCCLLSFQSNIGEVSCSSSDFQAWKLGSFVTAQSAAYRCKGLDQQGEERGITKSMLTLVSAMHSIAPAYINNDEWGLLSEL